MRENTQIKNILAAQMVGCGSTGITKYIHKRMDNSKKYNNMTSEIEHQHRRK